MEFEGKTRICVMACARIPWTCNVRDVCDVANVTAIELQLGAHILDVLCYTFVRPSLIVMQRPW